MTAYDLITFNGFLECFWEIYRAGTMSQEKVYEYLEEIYFERFGEHRFKSFSAFRYQRDRRNR